MDNQKDKPNRKVMLSRRRVRDNRKAKDNRRARNLRAKHSRRGQVSLRAKANLKVERALPGAMADTLFNSVVYPEGHPYGRPFDTDGLRYIILKPRFERCYFVRPVSALA